MAAMDNLEWLHLWYRSHCNGHWEHTRGLRLHRLEEAPGAIRGAQQAGTRRRGWRLAIKLSGSCPAAMRPRSTKLKSLDGGWLHCSITSERFIGTCDSDRLEQVIGVFRRWVQPALDAESAELEAAAGAGYR